MRQQANECGKIYAYIDIDDRNGRPIVTSKLEPAFSDMLRSKYENIVPGYYMNTIHWSTIYLDGNVPFVDDLYKYCNIALKTAREQKEYFTGPLGNDVFQCSPMPWVTYTHISHTNSGKKDNVAPLFDWGKYYEKNEKIILPISVQIHPSFVDGLYIGQFVDKLQSFFDGY